MATVTVTPGYNWVSGEVVTPAKMNLAAQPTASVSGIVDADIASGAAIALSKLATGALPTAITVASANMVTATAQALLPAGAVMPFAMNSAPSGWLAANGDAVSRSTYAALFAAISTTHGVGDGSTTFNVPDLRGVFVRGSGSQTISGTAYSGTFAAKQQDALKTHTHTYSWKGTTYGGAFGGNGGTWQSDSTQNSGNGPQRAPAPKPALQTSRCCIASSSKHDPMATRKAMARHPRHAGLLGTPRRASLQRLRLEQPEGFHAGQRGPLECGGGNL
jgi:microcystin-dependent protein